MTDSALEEIRAIRSRLAYLETVATAAATTEGDKPMDLESAVGGHYRPTEPPPAPEQKQLASIARGFVPDPQSEDALKARAKDPAGYDRATEAMHVSGLPLAIYSRQREAAVKLGTFVPDKEGAK